MSAALELCSVCDRTVAVHKSYHGCKRTYSNSSNSNPRPSSAEGPHRVLNKTWNSAKGIVFAGQQVKDAKITETCPTIAIHGIRTFNSKPVMCPLADEDNSQGKSGLPGQNNANARKKAAGYGFTESSRYRQARHTHTARMRAQQPVKNSTDEEAVVIEVRTITSTKPSYPVTDSGCLANNEAPPTGQSPTKTPPDTTTRVGDTTVGTIVDSSKEDSAPKAMSATGSASTTQQNAANDENESPEGPEIAEEEVAPLSFQIPSKTLREKMQASENVQDRFWSYKLYRGSDDELLPVHYCKTFEVAEHVAKYFLDEKILGFDIEWRPFANAKSIKQNVSVIQIASADRIALFHIALFNGTTTNQLLPPTLKTIIQSPDILKAGVAIKADFTRLQKYLQVESLGVFELSRLHNLVENYTTDLVQAASRKQIGLAAQVQQHLLLPLSKGDVRQSDWSLTLTPTQIEYAASDAYAGIRIFDTLERKRKLLRPLPPRPLVCDFDEQPSHRNSQLKRIKRRIERELKEASGNVENGADILEEEGVERDEDYETATEELSDSEDSQDISPGSAIQSLDIEKHSGKQQLREEFAGINLTSRSPIEVSYPDLPDLSSESDTSESSDASDLATPRRAKHMSQGTTETKARLESTKSPAKRIAALEAQSNSVFETEAKFFDQVPGPEAMTAATPTSNDGFENPGTSVNDPSRSDNGNNSRSAEYRLAEEWARSYLLRTIPSPSSTTTSRIRATAPPLRAYHLWHHQHLTIEAISRHMRSPPLASSTVSNYILQAVTLEKLDYSQKHMRDVLRHIPLGLKYTKWKKVADKVG